MVIFLQLRNAKQLQEFHEKVKCLEKEKKGMLKYIIDHEELGKTDKLIYFLM